MIGFAEKYPSIVDACLRISEDNGGINRFRSEATIRDEFESFMWDSLGVYDFDEIETYLSSLNEEELNIACAGDNDSMNIPEGTDWLLNKWFDERG